MIKRLLKCEKSLKEEASKEVHKMAQEKTTSTNDVVVKNGRTPDFKGDGVSVWMNTDKNGKPYLAISVLNNKPIHAFKYEGKKEGGDEQ